VVVDVLIAQREAQNALPQKHIQIVLDEILIAKIGETIRELRAQLHGAIRLAK
jgi:hypothetical protein